MCGQGMLQVIFPLSVIFPVVSFLHVRKKENLQSMPTLEGGGGWHNCTALNQKFESCLTAPWSPRLH